MIYSELLFIAGLAFIAYFYSSVGHGGASGYLALMALFEFAPGSIRIYALMMNVVVSSVAFISYYRAGYFKFRIIWPFLITSMPAAYWGSKLSIDPVAYKIILGIMLVIAVFRMLFFRNNENLSIKDPPFLIGIIAGILLGVISGIIGIGGGILLSPLLILAGYARVKEASAASAIFIFLNSAAGLFGLLSEKLYFHSEAILWLMVVLVAGFLGSTKGSRAFSEINLKRVLSVILFAASLKLFFF
jgi:uncharacterized membrane protein YfcA